MFSISNTCAKNDNIFLTYLLVESLFETSTKKNNKNKPRKAVFSQYYDNNFTSFREYFIKRISKQRLEIVILPFQTVLQ